MGFPVTRFSTLYDIATNDYFKPEFRRFKQIAIILHDPYDEDFKGYLQDNFSLLDYLSGQNFLFITFVNRPRGWEPGIELVEDGIKNLTASNNSDNADLMYTFCERADISTCKLPKILFLENWEEKEFISLQTNANILRKQLVSIGEFFNNRPTPIYRKEKMQFLRTIGDITYHCSKDSLMDILRDLYAIEESRKGVSIYKDEAKKQIKDATDHLVELHKHAQSDDKDKLLLDLLNYILLQQAEVNVNNPIREGLRIDLSLIEGCEPASKTDILRYNKAQQVPWQDILSAYFSQNSLFSNDEPLPSDESLCAKYLGQFLEREINLSLVQKIRAIKGIPMPDYWGKYYNANNGRYKVNTGKDRSVDVNFQLNYKLKNITLGDFTYAYKAILEDKQYNNLIENLGEGFLNMMDILYPLRNGGTHYADEFTEQNAEVMRHHFTIFLERYFPQLVTIKNQLKQ